MYKNKMKRKFKQLQEKLIKQLLHEIEFTERIDLKSVKYLLYLIFSYETHGTKAPEWLVSSDMYDEYQTQGEYIKSQLMYLYRKHRPAWKYKYKQMKNEEEFTEWVLEEPTGCLTAARFMHPEVQGNLLKALAVHKDMIISGSDDETIIKIWTMDGECLKTLEGHSDYVRALAVHNDMIISGSEDETIQVWEG